MEVPAIMRSMPWNANRDVPPGEKWQQGQNSWQPVRHGRACPGDLDRGAQCADYRDGRDKPGHDRVRTATSFAPLTENAGKRLVNANHFHHSCLAARWRPPI